jgi:hypothetical protein
MALSFVLTEPAWVVIVALRQAAWCQRKIVPL